MLFNDIKYNTYLKNKILFKIPNPLGIFHCRLFTDFGRALWSSNRKFKGAFNFDFVCKHTGKTTCFVCGSY